MYFKNKNIMKFNETSIFRLIKFFTQNKTIGSKVLNRLKYCEQENVHDFYCKGN